MSNFDTFTANGEDMVASDGEDFQMNSALVLLAEAVTDEDSDHDGTSDVVPLHCAQNHCAHKISLYIY